MENYDLTYEGSEVQKILDTGDELQTAGYIFRGEATPSTIPGTPTERVAYIGGAGTYNNFGTEVVVPSGSIVLFKYDGSSWSSQVFNVSSNGYIYAGIAGPTTVPVTGNVFYVALTAGTYTNFDSLVLTSGLNILKFNGSAWAQEQIYSFETYPTQGSSGIASSGGTDTVIRSLTDIFTCSTAAATAAKTISTSYYVLRTGGCIKVTFTYANTADDATLQIGSADAKPLFFNGARASSTNSWQAGQTVEIYYDGTNYQAHVIPVIDVVPNAGSPNLVESGGVASVFQNENTYLNVSAYPYAFANGQWYDPTIRHICISIPPSSRIEVKTSNNTYYSFLKSYNPPAKLPATIDSNDFATGYSDRVSGSTKNGITIIAPADAKFFYLSLGSNASISVEYICVNGVLFNNTITEKVDKLNKNMLYKGVMNIDFSVIGGIGSSDGVSNSSTDYLHTPYISVTQGDRILYDVKEGSTGWCAIACYDSSGNYLSGSSISGTNKGEFVVPNGVATVRLASQTSYDSTMAKYVLLADDVKDGIITKEKLSTELSAIVNRELKFDIDGGVGSNGTIAYGTNTGRKITGFVRVFVGEQYKYDVNAASSGWAAVAAFDDSFTYIESKSIPGISGRSNIGVYTVPEGVSYLIFTGLSSYDNNVDFITTDLFDGSIYLNQVGGLGYSDGTESSNTDYIRTNYIGVAEGDIITVDVKCASSGWCCLAMYDSSYNYVKSKSVSGIDNNTPVKKKFVIPEGISYVRISCQKTYNYSASKNKIIRENQIYPRVNTASYMKYLNIMPPKGCVSIQMDLGKLDNSYSGHISMLNTLRSYGLMSMDFAINITALSDIRLDWLNNRQQEGCEIIYHNRVNSPSDISSSSQLTVEEAKEGVCAERLAMAQKGFTTYGIVANNGSIGTQYKPMVDDLFFWSEYESASIVTSTGAETTKSQYLTDHRINRTGFEIRYDQYTQELEEEVITKGKAWIDTLCQNHSMGVMYCHFYNTFVDNYQLYENVLKEMAEYIVEKINDGELYYGSTTECLNYLCK